MNVLFFIRKAIEEKRYTILSKNIADGIVYKINCFGNLETDGFEIGYLYLLKGSGIKSHEHINDVERYKRIIGDLVINGNNCDKDICMLGKTHGIDCVSKDTIIETCKVSKKYLMETVIPFDSEFFDNMIIQELAKREMPKIDPDITKNNKSI